MATKPEKHDAKVESTVKKMRAFFAQSPMPSISTLQQNSLRERHVHLPVWVSRVSLPCPEDAVRTVMYRGIKSLSSEGWGTLKLPSLVPIEVEWVGYKSGVDSEMLENQMSQKERYGNLMKEVTSNVTLLYVHGGGFYRGDPSGFRPSVCKIAQLTRGRCISVRYRLAPQHPFPAALLDVFITYLSLLYPPPDSFHEPISASNIIIAGDSAGANLCLALIQLILQLHRENRSACTVKFFDRDVAIPIPAGVASFSAWTDATCALPSFTANEGHDYFSPSMPLERVVPCDIWPTNPPRGALYCDISALCHPMVSPTIAVTWVGAPPMWFCCGEEMLVDNSRIIAQRAANQGCTVIWAEYDAMPHCFPFLFKLPQTDHTFKMLARFCDACVENPNNLRSQGIRVATSMNVQSVDVRNLIELSQEEVEERMRQNMKKMAKRYQEINGVEPKL